ncbi:MAG: diguanylate cyclase domain-containing protein [Alphaproteobacteria bacterium]
MPTLAVVVLIAVMIVQAASWRMISRTLQADEPAQLVMLVGLERSLEALKDAVLHPHSARPVDNVAAARAAVVERLYRLEDAAGRADAAPPDGVVAEAERALLAVSAWQARPGRPVTRLAAADAVARAHAVARVGVFTAQQEALAWSRSVDRQIDRILKVTTAFWLAVAVGGAAVGVAFARVRRRARRRLRQTERALVRSEHLARHDALTGVANRRRLDAELNAAIRAAAAGPPFALHLLDVDGLKAINDRWGHAAGDVLLAAVARALTASVRTGDVVGRLGGDEFAVIQRDATPETAAILAKRMHEAVAVPVSVRDGARVVPQVSIGIALYGVDGTTAPTLLDAADDRLYRDKPERSLARSPDGLRLVQGG